jgi:hypothetical protein
MTNYIVADTEGSGLFDYKKPADAVGQPRMAAIGMILCTESLEIEEEHAFLIKPDGWTFDNDSEAAKVNGLTHERLMAEGVRAADALRVYGAAIDARRVVVGWNVMHDLKMLRGELRSVGFPDRYMQTRYLCAMQGSRRVVDARTADGRKKAPKLAEACVFFGVDQGDDGHTGIGDARSTLAILRKLREMGEMPEYIDPYNKGKPKAAAPRPQGRAYEEMVVREQQDFLRGASEDEK